MRREFLFPKLPLVLIQPFVGLLLTQAGCGVYLDQQLSVSVDQIFDTQNSSTSISALVGENNPLSISVKNTSNATIQTISLDLDSSHFTVDSPASNCLLVEKLEQGETCDFMIQFNSSRTGTYEEVAQLKITQSSGSQKTFEVALKATAGFNWKAVGSEFWEDIQDEINFQAGQGSSGVATASYVGPDFSSTWAGGVLAPNGKIYGAPYNATTILEFDPEDFNNSREITPDSGALPSGGSKYWGGVLAPNGKIYMAPYAEDKFLEVDPNDPEAAKKVGPVLNSSGCCQCHGSALAPNGKIYCVPEDNAYVLEFDPEDPNSSREITDIDFSSDSSWEGLRLAPNGKLYAVPDDRSTILEIDARTDTVTLTEITPSPALPGSNSKWEGGSLTPDGNILAFPEYNGDGLLIDTDNPTNSTVLAWGLGGGSGRYSGGTLAANGKIYGGPADSSTVLEVDPDDILNPTEFGSGFGERAHLIHAPNGKLYGLPAGSASKVLEIDPKSLGELDLQILLHPLLNGY